MDDAEVAFVLSVVALFLVFIGLMLTGFVYVWLEERIKRFDKHIHKPSTYGGTSGEPMSQKEINIVQLLELVQSVQNQGTLDSKAVEVLIDSFGRSPQSQEALDPKALREFINATLGSLHSQSVPNRKAEEELSDATNKS